MYTNYDQPTAVHLIRRRKLGVPTAWHLGVAFEFKEPARLYIVEFQVDGLRMLTLRDFANDRDVEILRTIQHPRWVGAAIRRLNYFIDRAGTLSYDPLFRNCEHFARLVVEGKRQSMQVHTGVGLGILACAGVAALLIQPD